MKKILTTMLTAALLGAFAQGFEEERQRAEQWLDRTYKPGSQDHGAVRKKLQAISDSAKSEKEKIAELHKEFPKAFSAKPDDAEALYQKAVGFADREDYVSAVKYGRIAAEQGHAEAQFGLGVCYANGYGVKKDPDEAAKWYRKAADQGVADAQNNLGLCYSCSWNKTS